MIFLNFSLFSDKKNKNVRVQEASISEIWANKKMNKRYLTSSD